MKEMVQDLRAEAAEEAGKAPELGYIARVKVRSSSSSSSSLSSSSSSSSSSSPPPPPPPS
jgi:hypothetical protein